MDQLEAVGFDMDWTLAQYNEDFDLLAYNGAEKLISLRLPGRSTAFRVLSKLVSSWVFD